MLMMTPALPATSHWNAWTDVAFPSSVCNRQMNPGMASAAAFTGSSAATKRRQLRAVQGRAAVRC